MISLEIPHNHEAEAKILGALMECPELLAEKLAAFPDEAFFSPSHAKIFGAIRASYARHGKAPPEAVADLLVERRQLDDIGGHYALANLIAAVPSAANFSTWQQIVLADLKGRDLIRMATKILRQVDDRDHPPEGIAQEARSEIDRISAQGGGESAFVSLAEGMPCLVERLIARQEGQSHGLGTGLGAIDRHLRGLEAGQMIVLAARPSLGKTALAMNIAAAVASGPKAQPVGVFSLEMTHKELMDRLASAAASVNLGDHAISRPALQRLCDATLRLAPLPILIDDSPRLSVSQIRLRALEMRQRQGLALLVIDYLQLIRGEGLGKNANREQEIAGISRGLKALAKELELPILVLAQLNREAGDGARPRLSQLRESGQIEQDADVVLLLHRDREEQQQGPEKEPDPSGEPRRLKTELVVAKNRNGATGCVELSFIPEYVRFDSPSPADAKDAWF